MHELRRHRLESVLWKELTWLVARELRDPRVSGAHFTGVTLSVEGSVATVWVLPLQAGSSETPSVRMVQQLEGLKAAVPYLRRLLKKILVMKHVPFLLFQEDRGLERSLKVQALLQQVKGAGSSSTQSEDSTEASTEDER